MKKHNKDIKVYNLKLDSKLIQRLDHLKIDLGISRQQLIDDCLRFSLDAIDRSEKVKRRIISLS